MGTDATHILRRILSANPKRHIADPLLTPAAVMVLVYPKDGEYHVLLNLRTNHVEHHKGEISFPGGVKDEGDATSLDTALRETFEEMGILPEDIELLGKLDDMPTSTRYLMSPHVGTIPYPYRFRPNEQEVASIIEIPISVLLDEDSVRDEVRIVDGRLVNSPAYAYRGHVVFGATARVLTRFLELLDTAPEEEAPWKRTRPLR